MFTRRSLYRTTLLIGLFTITLALCSAVSVSRAEEVKVITGPAPSQNIFSRIKDPMEKSIGLKLVIVTNDSSVDVFKQFAKGSSDACASGSTFTDWVALMQRSGVPVDANAYKSEVIGTDIIRVFTNKEAGVRTLSKEQVKGIFSGKITNWKEVGGKDIPVKVVWCGQLPVTNNVFQKQLMDGESFSPRATEAVTAADIKELVTTIRGGVSFGALSMVDSTVAVPQAPEISRPITIVTRGNAPPAILKMVEYIRGAGNQYVLK